MSISNHDGFTLLEVLLTLLIIVLAGSLAVPTLQAVLHDQDLEADAHELAWVLRLARQEALYTGAPSYVKFYCSNDTYVYQDTRYEFNPGISYTGTPTFPTRVGSIPACVFLPTGRPGAGGTVVLGGSNEQRRYIIVNPVAGRIRISEEPPQSW